MVPVKRSSYYFVPAILAVGAVFALALLLTETPLFPDREDAETLRIATTTSLDDAGLLDELLPHFEERYDIQTSVIAVGTGQALKLGERGDVDVVLVHAPALEHEFIEQGFGLNRTNIMTNPFVIVGPPDDPASIRGASNAGDALLRIADADAFFISRGDNSGTHFKELEIWEASEYVPASDLNWYHPAGQGMGETLLTAHELEAYALTDRATFIAMSDQLSGLSPLFGAPGEAGEGDPALDNSYSVVAVNPAQNPDARIDLASVLIEWLSSESAGALIAGYGMDRYHEPLFTLVEDS